MASQVDHGLGEVCRLVGWWDEIEVSAFLAVDELKTPEPDMGAWGEADVAPGR
jgi:hypothetical protein